MFYKVFVDMIPFTQQILTSVFRVPTWLLWPVSALSVISQTVAMSSVMSVPLTLILSPMVSLVQGFLSIPM